MKIFLSHFENEQNKKSYLDRDVFGLIFTTPENFHESIQENNSVTTYQSLIVGKMSELQSILARIS